MSIFKLKENGTNIKTELLAGITTFLTMIYIVPVNSHIVSNTGMPLEALITATALITIIASALNGLFANTPVAMSVGMGMNAYFTFSVCIAQQIPWQSALGAVFLSGFIFLILSFTNFRLWIIRNIPKDLRLAICAGIGCFIAFLGLQKMGIIVKNDATLVGVGNFKDPSVLFGIFSLILVVFFWALKLRAAFILGVLLSSLALWSVAFYLMQNYGVKLNIEGAIFPNEIFSLPNFSRENGLGAIAFELDIKSALSVAMIPVILTFFITQLFDSIGTITGVGARGKIFNKPVEGEKKLGKTLMADAASSVVGAGVGTSTVTAFVESTTGVESGGRTGLVAIVVACCFALTLFLLPLFKAIPPNAIYPVLVMVGILMFMEVKNIDFSDSAIAVGTFFTIIMMPLTYSITSGFAFGFISFLLVRIFKREWDKISVGIVVLSLISLGNFLLIALN
ncbi:NCS2 family permease [Campylobacter upsaliensis]